MWDGGIVLGRTARLATLARWGSQGRINLIGTLALNAQGFGFLNTASVGTDAAYLGVLRRLRANIEPDWIAFQAALP